ncbi:hypothetical protein [Candidatus Albibeggiatoa sp. nov. NOAA]|uniref:hypothetical protein n=1 Tax=Candidatus Albibeggiatoa sp. nov. NOAA TaxID=3162724 RepID=UPI0032F26869|nr:hypothetical protein [Thiotrichaceae bacterium]
MIRYEHIAIFWLNVGLGAISIFIFFSQLNPYQSASNKQERNINNLLKEVEKSLSKSHFLDHFALIAALSAIIFYPFFPSIFALFIIIVRLQNFILPFIINSFTSMIIRQGFRYNLSNADAIKEFLRYLAPQQSLSDFEQKNHGVNRLSQLEMNAIEESFQKHVRKELKGELETVLYRIFLVWARAFSVVNAAILSILLFLIIV